jgi:hypothetical protein
MSEYQLISVLEAKVNGETWPLASQPKIKTGIGDKNITANSLGGDSVQISVGSDFTTKKSSCTLTLRNTLPNLKRKQSVENKIASNQIELLEKLDDGSSVTLVFPKMTLMTDPEITFDGEGSLDLEFEGAPMVRI